MEEFRIKQMSKLSGNLKAEIHKHVNHTHETLKPVCSFQQILGLNLHCLSSVWPEYELFDSEDVLLLQDQS